MFAVVAALSGCAGPPLVDVQRPGFSRAATVDIEPMTLSQARVELLELRATYREAMALQLSTTQYAGAGLVALGALVTGLAAGKAHPDAIVGISLLGGTSYAIGALTLDRRRVLAFDAGIKALDCSYAAVIPLDLGTKRLAALNVANQRLDTARKSAAAAANTLRASLTNDDKLKFLGAADAVAARRNLEAFDAALVESEKAQRAATQLGEDTRELGQRLQNTVHTIAARVDGFIAQTVPDVSAVQQAVAGLGGFAAMFAPGAGVDKTLATSLANFAPKSNSGTPDGQQAFAAFEVALKKLVVETAKLFDATAEVKDLLGTVNGASVVAALKACNAADVILPMSLEPSALTLQSKSGAGKGFAMKGGTRPYTVRWLDAAPDGLNLSFVGGLVDTAQIATSASTAVTPETYRLIVNDSTGQSAQLAVTVTASAGSTPPAGNDPGNPNEPAVTDDQARTINGLAPLTLKGTKVSIAKDSAKVADGKISFAIVCEPAAPSPKLQRADVIEVVLASAKVKISASLISLQANPVCLAN